MAVEKVYAIDRVATWKIHNCKPNTTWPYYTYMEYMEKTIQRRTDAKGTAEEVCFVMDQANIIESIRKMALSVENRFGSVKWCGVL